MSFLTILLYPFAVLYDGITRLRNYLYDSGYRTSFSFDTHVISVGNLSVGGTGKTPMVEYLIRLLSKDKKIVTLSRGYGRKTKGFRLADPADSAETLGDEPYQIYEKFKNIKVSVGEERAIAIPFILAENPETEVILLDDAYQHRPVKPNLNILLTDYGKPFFKDHLLPAGRLRENRNGAKRADIIIVTKCPEHPDFMAYEQSIKGYNPRALIAFSSIAYSNPVCFYGERNFKDNVFLFCGIANPAPIKEFVSNTYNLIGEKYYKDHHHYTKEDVNEIRRIFNGLDPEEKCLLTTEKDAVKLKPILDGMNKDLSIFILPIQTHFIKGGKTFDQTVLNSLNSYSN